MMAQHTLSNYITNQIQNIFLRFSTLIIPFITVIQHVF